MKGIFLSILGIVRWFRNAIIFLSVFPLCTLVFYFQYRTNNPSPPRWPWLESQETIIYTITFIDAVCLLWFFLEKIKKEKGWWIAIVFLALSIYTSVLCWLLQLGGDHSQIVATVQLLPLAMMLFINPLVSVLYIQFKAEAEKEQKAIQPVSITETKNGSDENEQSEQDTQVL